MSTKAKADPILAIVAGSIFGAAIFEVIHCFTGSFRRKRSNMPIETFGQGIRTRSGLMQLLSEIRPRSKRNMGNGWSVFEGSLQGTPVFAGVRPIGSGKYFVRLAASLEECNCT